MIKMVSYVDRLVDEGPIFKRYINGSEFSIMNGQLIDGKLKVRAGQYLTKLEPAGLENQKMDYKIITLDIETFQEDNGRLVPYAIG